MAKSIQAIPKKQRGRPKTTGRGEGILLRLHKPQLVALDGWIATLSDSPSRPEAIRRLVDRGLADKRPPHSPGKEPARKAKARHAAKLATRVIEAKTDKTAPAEEQERRKRRLVQGPREFRQVRGGPSKTKKNVWIF